MATSTVVIGSGPLGSAVTRRLVADGEPVRMVTRSGRGAEHPLVERYAADVTDRQQVRAAIAGASTVIHCGNPASYTSWDTTLRPLLMVPFEAAAEIGAVYAGSEALYAYGPSATPLTPQHPYDSPARKGQLRAALIRERLAAHEAGTARAVLVAGSDYIGPEVLVSHAGERFVPRILAGKSVRTIGDPALPHAFTYIEDMATALVTAARTETAWGRLWHAPTNEALSLRTIAGLLAAEAGTTTTVRGTSIRMVRAIGRVSPLMRELAELGYQWDRPYLVDSTPMREEFGLAPTPWDEIVPATVRWYADRADRARQA